MDTYIVMPKINHNEDHAQNQPQWGSMRSLDAREIWMHLDLLSELHGLYLLNVANTLNSQDIPLTQPENTTRRIIELLNQIQFLTTQ